MIAATTVGTGYDIGNYISHSPGTDELDPKPIEDINDPKRYFGEITASLSATILALAFVITRIVHLAQHMRVVYYLYARWSTLTVAKRNDVSRSTRQFEAKIQDRKGDTSKPGLHDPEAHWIAAIPPHLKAITAGLLSFLLSLLRTASGFSQILVEQLQGNPNITYWRNNVVMKHFILERGLVWEDEFNNFLDTLSNATGAEKSMVMPAWTQRLTLTLALKSFKDFNGGEDSIPGDLLPVITSYYENLTQVIKDLEVMPENPEEAAFYQIVDGLISGSVLSTRCIIGFAGLILISLSLQDFIHSWPRDRYQWGVITSRFVMGIVLCLLLLLNIGRYQELVVPNDKLNQRAGVFQWLEAFWVLPTIAIAYGVQFLVEIILARFAKKALKRAEASEKPEEIND
ncbi:unnamed protein product [Rhizoctonia solani]|uniref:Uncharacterized protein n=1 Tax=Rhizoctonia solani TaxID=456999 RepID=A0A8H3BVR1_9AGAM|nr:unnamed protein product [Rhizoctonia solani]